MRTYAEILGVDYKEIRHRDNACSPPDQLEKRSYVFPYDGGALVYILPPTARGIEEKVIESHASLMSQGQCCTEMRTPSSS
jgi:hypothetical protein